MAGAEQQKLKEYLLGQRTEAEEEQIELSLLTDSDFAEEFDIAVDEMIDDYVAGHFAGDELEQVERYFFESPERRDKLKFALALKARKSEIGTDKGKRLWFTPYLAIAASLILIAGGFYVWRMRSQNSDLNKGLAALQSAYGEQRPLEARLSDFSYAPLSNQRGGPAKIDYLKRDLAASLLLKEVGDHPSSKSHQALGQYYLAEHQFDKAIDQFKAALELEPNNAKTHSDLGAALFERGKTHLGDATQGKGIQEFAESLPHLNQALEIDNSRLEALFNRALLYEHMGLLPQAENDWRRYLEQDTNSKWSAEARQNLKRIEDKKKKTSQSNEEIFQEFLKSYELRDDQAAWSLVSSYYNRAGNIVVEHLLDAYLVEAAGGRKEQALRNLQLLSHVGELAKQNSADPYFADLAHFYKFTTTDQCEILTRARALMKKGHDGWGQIRVDENFSLFSQAKQLFDAAGDLGESRLAEYWQSFCYYRQHDDRQSLLILEPLVSTSENNGYKNLLSRSLYLLAAVQFNRNEHSKAVESASSSLALADQMNDTVGTINALSSLTEYFRYLGNYEQSLSYIQRSLPLVSSISMEPIQGSRLYGFEATAFASAGLTAAAAAFQNEALRFALSTGNASVISYNYAFLGIINGRLRNFSEGLRNAELAYEVARDHTSEAPDRELMAFALLQMGHIYRQAGNFDLANVSYERSIESYERLNHPTNLYQAHKGRFLCYIAQKNDALAKRELATSLKLAEGYRDKILEETIRESFFDAEQNLYDVAIDFEYSRANDPQEAYQLSESSHARSLLDLIHSDSEVLNKSRKPEVIPGSVSSPLSSAEIRRQMPEQTEILQYGVLESKLLIWVVSKERISPVAREISQKELTDKVLGYLNLASSRSASNSQELQSRAKDLFDILIKPVESLLDPSKQICVVPDKVLCYLPFAALVSSSSGRYLIEDYRLIVSPSSTVFIVSSQIAREKKEMKEEERLLSVGNPKFDRKAFPSFSDLPSATEEATEVAAYYKSPKVLTGAQARIDVVTSEMERSDVIHLALHAALDERFPLRSKMLLAKDPNVAGTDVESVLYAYEIYGLKLARTRLAVLSACETGAEHYYGGEGMISMARPFLAARVPIVVASLWPLDSDSTRELMVNFQKGRKLGGMSTVDALRNAQITMLHSRNDVYWHPYYWAPFIVIGGYAEF